MVFSLFVLLELEEFSLTAETHDGPVVGGNIFWRKTQSTQYQDHLLNDIMYVRQEKDIS